MKQSIIWLILDYSLSPVLPKTFEGVKKRLLHPFVRIWSENSKTTPISDVRRVGAIRKNTDLNTWVTTQCSLANVTVFD